MNCSLCGGPLTLLGILGRRYHYRCRNCGMDCSSTEPLVDDIDGDEDDEWEDAI